jgi:hypothetical protein
MLDDLRKNQKSIIWAIAIVFVLGMAVMGITEVFYPKPFVGKIYGKKVLLQNYDPIFRTNVDFYRMNNPEETLTDQTIQNINDQTWNHYVAREVMDRQIKRYRIRVKDSDVMYKFEHDPPSELLQVPLFMTDGVFDHAKYLDFFRTNREYAFQLEQDIRQMLPYELLEQRIKSQVVVTEDSVRADWLSRNERASGMVISFDWNTIPEQEVTETEIATYHSRNSSNFRKEATRKYTVAQIAMVPTADDTLRTREEIYFVHGQVLAGEDFGILARDFSGCPSSQNDGYLDFFGRGMMAPEFEAASFALNPGEVSAPFLTQFGWHIVKVTDRRVNDAGEPEVEASHILLRIEPSDATRMNVRYTAEMLYDLADRRGLVVAAQEMGIETRETAEFFSDADFINGLGRFPNLVTEAFKRNIGFRPDPIRMPDGSFAVVELTHRQATHIQPLAEVSEVIRREIDKEKRMAIALEMANEILKADHEEYFDLATEKGFRVANFNDILINRSISGIGNVRVLNNAIFNTEAEQWTELIHGDNGLYKAFVTSRTSPPIDVFYSQLDRLTQEYRTARENAHYNEWYQRVIREANVIDLRYMYY